MKEKPRKFTNSQIENWKAYENVRRSGETNMFASNAVFEYPNLDREEVIFCMKNYSELKEQAEATNTISKRRNIK